MIEIIVTDFKKENSINKLVCTVNVTVNTNDDDIFEVELAAEQFKKHLLETLKLAKSV